MFSFNSCTPLGHKANLNKSRDTLLGLPKARDFILSGSRVSMAPCSGQLPWRQRFRKEKESAKKSLSGYVWTRSTTCAIIGPSAGIVNIQSNLWFYVSSKSISCLRNAPVSKFNPNLGTFQHGFYSITRLTKNGHSCNRMHVVSGRDSYARVINNGCNVKIGLSKECTIIPNR